MHEWLYIGAAPPEESCAQVGSDGYMARARRECQAYINLLRRVVGPEPEGAQLRIRSDQHDLGTYLSVACYYDPAIEATIDYAFRCEGHGPQEWDEEARRELRNRKGERHGHVD